ncbi:MAG: hypothetical protein VW830_08555, partial [Rhodobiaceae bacterium]
GQRLDQYRENFRKREKHMPILDNSGEKAQHTRTSRHHRLPDPCGFHPSLKFSSTGANGVCGVL